MGANLYDTELVEHFIEIDGTNYRLREPIWVQTSEKGCYLEQTLSGIPIEYTFRRRQLTGIKKLLYSVLNKFGIFSCESNKTAYTILLNTGVIDARPNNRN